MNNSDESIADAIAKLKQWILLECNILQEEVSQHNALYSSSLMIQLFLRRVVEIYFIEGCYSKVGGSWKMRCRLWIILLRTPWKRRFHFNVSYHLFELIWNGLLIVESRWIATWRCLSQYALLLSWYHSTSFNGSSSFIRRTECFWEVKCDLADTAYLNIRSQRTDSTQEMYVFGVMSIVAVIQHITSDDQLPLLILVIVESPLTNIMAQIQFMNGFDFMHSRNNELE